MLLATPPARVFFWCDVKGHVLFTVSDVCAYKVYASDGMGYVFVIGLLIYKALAPANSDGAFLSKFRAAAWLTAIVLVAGSAGWLVKCSMWCVLIK